MGEDRGDAAVQLRVYEADAADTDDAKVRAEAEEPVDGDLVLHVELVLLDCAVVPDAHYHHEEGGKDDRDPGLNFVGLYLLDPTIRYDFVSLYCFEVLLDIMA